MKVGRSFWTPEHETPLPPEIIELVITYACSQVSPTLRQSQLWSYCLVSKSWYSTAVEQLYYAPVLTGRNFTEFATTMCPPVNARVPKIGLESCIHHLDMGMLAYESRKSITARLIRRTNKALESFVAPAVTFAVNCLAPLSKCSNLKVLDLSRDSYDIKLFQLLSAINGLEQLEHLSLPKKGLQPGFGPQHLSQVSNGKAVSLWPPNLTHLTLTDDSHITPDGWRALLTSWPSSLYSLALVRCDILSIGGLHQSEEPIFFDQITALAVDIRRKHSKMTLFEICNAFPKVEILTLSAVTRWTAEEWAPECLEQLILRHSPDFIAPKNIYPAHLLELAQHCPRLTKIEVPETYVDFEKDPDGLLTDALNDVLEKRSRDKASRNLSVEDFGVFLTEVDDSAAAGLKRSLSYPED